MSLNAQISATAVLDRSSVETGDTFLLKVIVSGVAVAPEQIDFTPWKPFLPVENVLSRSEWRKTGAQWLQQCVLISFDSAHLNLPPLRVRLHLGDTVSTNVLELIVFPTPASTELTDAETIRPIYREPIGWLDFWPYYIIVLAGMVFIWAYFKRKPKPLPPIPVQAVPVMPAFHETALAALKKLEIEQSWKKGKVKEYYASLSLILREYIENQFNIPALESTTIEIERMLKKSDFPESLRATVQEVLFRADMAKYAQAITPDQNHEKYLIKSQHIVQQTAVKSAFHV